MTKTEQKKYEMMVIISSALTEKKREDALKEVKKLMEANGGKIETEKEWGLRQLAYRIKKEDEGFYFIFHFWQSPQKIREIEREMNIDTRILRQLVIAVPDDEELVIYPDVVKEPKESPKPSKKSVKKEAPQKKEAPKKADVEEDFDDEDEDEKSLEDVENKLNKIIDGTDINL